MTYQEVTDLLRIIKTSYQNFSMDKDVVDYWFNVLNKYDSKDVTNRLCKHMESEDYKEIPKVNRLVLGLETLEDKANQHKYDDYLVQCNLCKKWFKYKNIDFHYDRCLDIQFLVNKSYNVGKPMTRIEIEELPPKKIEELLNKYLPKRNFTN